MSNNKSEWQITSEWLESKNGCYEGLELYVPSTNNALEATNRVIKDDPGPTERHVNGRKRL
jgi:hypothetical protein